MNCDNCNVCVQVFAPSSKDLSRPGALQWLSIATCHRRAPVKKCAIQVQQGKGFQGRYVLAPGEFEDNQLTWILEKKNSGWRVKFEK